MIQLSDHFTYRKLLRFTLPSMVMMIFTSIYGIVDGFFVSNFVGKTAFTAVNFIMPVLMILGGVGFLFGTGGGALIAKTIGEGKKQKANELFSMLVYLNIACGVALAMIGIVLIRPVASLLGAEGQLLEDSVLYARVCLITLPAFVLQFEFQCFFATAQKPQLGLYVTVAAGITNILFDTVFVGLLSWGLVGAAAATCLGQCVGGIVPLLYFIRPNHSLLRLTKAKFDGNALLKAITNGSSELLNSISSSIVGMLYNTQLLRYTGEDGVAAYGVIMYVNMFFSAMFIGYTVGSAPIVSYNYGAQRNDELKELRKKSVALILGFAFCMFASAELMAGLITKLFVGYDAGLSELTKRAFVISSFSFLFSGFGMFGSSFFTALNNGMISASIAFVRTLVFQIAAVLLFPLVFGIDGIWLSITAAEMLTLIVVVILLVWKQKEYHY